VTAMIRRSMAVMKGIEFQIMILSWRTRARLGLPYHATWFRNRHLAARISPMRQLNRLAVPR
jgi:hypothetical protein